MANTFPTFLKDGSNLQPLRQQYSVVFEALTKAATLVRSNPPVKRDYPEASQWAAIQQQHQLHTLQLTDMCDTMSSYIKFIESKGIVGGQPQQPSTGAQVEEESVSSNIKTGQGSGQRR